MSDKAAWVVKTSSHDLIVRTLHYYNVGDGLTRAEIVDMAREIRRLREVMLKAATAITVAGSGKTETTALFPNWSIVKMLRDAAAARAEA